LVLIVAQTLVAQPPLRAHCLGGGRSIQLSYGAFKVNRLHG